MDIPANIDRRPWLTISRDGKVNLATPRSALKGVEKQRVVFIFDLRAAWQNFDALVGDKRDFAAWEVRAVYGLKAGPFTRAVRDGLIPPVRGEYPGWRFDRAGAFVAGVQGALVRQGVPHKTRLAVAEFLVGVLRAEPAGVGDG